jgi:hypothetical protein
MMVVGAAVNRAKGTWISGQNAHRMRTSVLDKSEEIGV